MSSCREGHGLGSEEILTKRGIGSKKQNVCFPQRSKSLKVNNEKNMKNIWKKEIERLYIYSYKPQWKPLCRCRRIMVDPWILSWLLSGSKCCMPRSFSCHPNILINSKNASSQVISPVQTSLVCAKGFACSTLRDAHVLSKHQKQKSPSWQRWRYSIYYIHMMCINNQINMHIYIYVHVFNIFYPSIFPESPVYHPQLTTFIKKSQASCTAASPYLTPNISPTGSLFTMSLTHLSDTSLTTELAGETCKEVPATISRSASVSSGSCLKNLRFRNRNMPWC